MASHRMPDSDRPRRPVPSWVTAPPTDAAPAAAGLESRPTPATSHAAQGAPGLTAGAHVATTVTALAEQDVVVPDYPPQQELLPPAPTSPTVHTVPFRTPTAPPAPEAAVPVATAPVTLPAPSAAPAPPAVAPVPSAGQPRFSVPGLEHVVVEGTEPAPVGPIGYRTPRRFAAQQSAAAAPTPAPANPFDTVVQGSAAAAPAAPSVLPAPVVPAPAATVGGTAAPVVPATGAATGADAPTAALPATAPEGGPDAAAGAEPGLPSAAATRPRRALGATPGAVLGALTGVATLGLAAWWFTAPGTVHAVGLVLGALALVLSIATLRNAAATWQRPVALLGAVLGGVGTLVLLWAVAAALLPLAGVTLPDLTGSGTTPTLAP